MHSGHANSADQGGRFPEDADRDDDGAAARVTAAAAAELTEFPGAAAGQQHLQVTQRQLRWNQGGDPAHRRAQGAPGRDGRPAAADPAEPIEEPEREIAPAPSVERPAFEAEAHG